MEESISLLKLAYLIEISVVLNLTYREIKYSQTGKKLLVELERVMKELKKKEIDRKSEDVYPEYDKLQKIYHGKNKDAWQHSNYNRKFLKIS